MKIRLYQLITGFAAFFLTMQLINAQHVQPLDTSLYAPISSIVLNADGEGGEDTYDIIKAAFGSSPLEIPDLYSNNHPEFQHVQEGTDPEIGHYFSFFLHRDIDWDRDKYPGVSDRQRNEIKIYGGSKEQGKAREDEVFRYKWKVHIGETMTISKNFCHMFQLKAVDGDDSHPILTFSGSVNGGVPEVELLHSPSKIDTQIAKNNWENARGKWLDAECIALMADEGYLRFTLKNQGGEVVMETEQTDIDMWRDECTYVRPKWGLYRSLATKEMILNDTDTIKIANISIEELKLKSEITHTILSDDQKEDISITVAQDEFYIHNCAEGAYDISVYNMAGLLLDHIQKVELSGNPGVVPLRNVSLNNQILIIKLHTNNKIYNTKIIY